jgi:hypothetical protein
MKTKFFLAVILIAALSVPVFMHAQGKTPPNANTAVKNEPTTDRILKMNYCDEILPQTVKDLQSKADADCKTITTCVPCVERASNIEVYATVVIQPKEAQCKMVKGAMPYKVNPNEPKPVFYFDVLQSTCTREGVTLEVFMPGNDIRPGEYTFLWEIDGNKAGHAQRQECVCGSKATVTVTQSSTGKRAVREIILPRACGSND